MEQATGPQFLRFCIPIVETLKALGGSGQPKEITDTVLERLRISEREHHMPYVNVHSVNLFYEEYGKGPAVILTPGGRVDRNGLRPIAALLSPRCRVILHDRRNCGRSDVVIGGELSEQHLWAEQMADRQTPPFHGPRLARSQHHR